MDFLRNVLTDRRGRAAIDMNPPDNPRIARVFPKAVPLELGYARGREIAAEGQGPTIGRTC